MATIRKRNDKFQVQVRIRGHSKSATFLTLKHARHWGRQKELEFENSFQLGELYRPKHFLEVLDKSKNEKIDFFKTHALSYLSKLSERLGPSDFVYKIKTDNTKQKNNLEYDIFFKKFSNTQIILGSTLALIILSILFIL